MKFIKRDVNKRLLIFIAVLIMLLAGSTIYYAVTYTNLLNRYNKNQKVFGELTANAVMDTADIMSVQKYKENLEKRYDYLSTQNSDLSTFNTQLKAEITGLKSQLALLKSQIEYQKAKDIGPTEQFRLFQGKNDQISKLKEKIKNVCSEFEARNITSKECDGVS